MASAEILEAREAHAYWSHRAASLPWHKRAARREARELASRWRARLATAYLESWRLGLVAQLVAPLFHTRGRSMRRHVGWMAVGLVRRTTIGRLVLIGAAGFAAASFACLALVVAIAVHVFI